MSLPPINTSPPRSPVSDAPLSRVFKKVEAAQTYEDITEEDRLAAMLGHTTCKTGELMPMMYREDFCAVCGIQHKNPSLLDMYPYCAVCQNCLREPAVLRKRYAKTIQPVPLEILVATYGDPFDCCSAVVVTDYIIELINEYSTKDKLIFKPSMKLNEIFQLDKDLCPGKNKQLRIRYRMLETFASIAIDANPNNQIPGGFILRVPLVRYLTIVKASYGHPKGKSKAGRMMFDVTEKLQGITDLNGGSFLTISTMMSLSTLLGGDPCPGYVKDLCIEYDIDGRTGTQTQEESGGNLRRKLYVEESPVVAPLIYVAQASYGITPTGRRDRLLALGLEVKKIISIEHKLKQGLVMQASDVKHIKNKQKTLKERAFLRQVDCKFIDISERLQRIVDEGKTCLFIDKEKFDPNALFGNPYPGAMKLLEISLECQGHDSEKTTDSREVTLMGYPRNFITGKSARFIVPVRDEGDSVEQDVSRPGTTSEVPDDGLVGFGNVVSKTVVHGMKTPATPETALANKAITASNTAANSAPPSAGVTAAPKPKYLARVGKLDENLYFHTDNAAPIIMIVRAVYGYLQDNTKLIDVTMEVQNMVKGRFLEIGKDVDLDKVFTNPCKGLRKSLKVDYLTRGFSGTIRVREKDDYLVAAVELGYAPAPPRDDG